MLMLHFEGVAIVVLIAAHPADVPHSDRHRPAPPCPARGAHEHGASAAARRRRQARAMYRCAFWSLGQPTRWQVDDASSRRRMATSPKKCLRRLPPVPPGSPRNLGEARFRSTRPTCQASSRPLREDQVAASCVPPMSCAAAAIRRCCCCCAHAAMAAPRSCLYHCCRLRACRGMQRRPSGRDAAKRSATSERGATRARASPRLPSSSWSRTPAFRLTLDRKRCSRCCNVGFLGDF